MPQNAIERQPFLAKSRITAASGLTLTGGFDLTGGLTSGSDGTGVAALYAGTANACFLAMTASASAGASLAVTGAKQGDIVFLQTACTTGSAIITSASVTGNGKVEFKTYNTSGNDAAASTITVQYLVIRTGS